MEQHSRRRIRVVSAEIQREEQYLITQRLPRAVLPGLWEFPGGRVREGETDELALKRCLSDRLGVDASVGALIQEVVHDYPSYTLHLGVYRCDLGEQDPTARRVAAVAWVSPSDFGEYTFPDADQHTVEALLSDDSDER